MKKRFSWWWFAAGAGLVCLAPGLASAQATSEPTPLPQAAIEAAGLTADSPQAVAQAIARRLQESGQLRHYRIDITVTGGVAELRGLVQDEEQRRSAVQLAQTVPGVREVRDQLSSTAPAVQQAAQKPPQTPPALPPLPSPPSKPAPPGPVPPGPLPPSPEGVPPPPVGGMPAEPTPIFQAHPPVPGMLAQTPPPLPPYAWPTYAPYNNYSRVAYPLIYPYQAWPFIGPIYPFPKVPLGWRSIKLTWEDGHWWYSRVACGHDWWRIRFW